MDLPARRRARRPDQQQNRIRTEVAFGVEDELFSNLHLWLRDRLKCSADLVLEQIFEDGSIGRLTDPHHWGGANHHRPHAARIYGPDIRQYSGHPTNLDGFNTTMGVILLHMAVVRKKDGTLRVQGFLACPNMNPTVEAQCRSDSYFPAP
jgi:hypothetical protein